MSLFFGSSDIWSDTNRGLSWRLASWYSYNERIILLVVLLYVVLLYVVPTECTDHTEAYGLKLFESTEWPTLRDARIHRNECLRQTMGIILLVVLLYVVSTEYTDYTEAYGLKLFESTEWPTLREARIHRNECLLVCVLWELQAMEIQVQSLAPP